ncbi:TPA: ead/Ea22-like family protein [Escherichia coli]|nr:ead/Ea22-like family protein [Escherichia coli]
MSNINKQACDKLKSAAAKAVDNFDQNMFVETRDVLALLDELEAAQNRSVELPSFDGYVPHIAKELQAAFKIACAASGITVKGDSE